MFVCSRCGSSYNARHLGVEHCPRCRLRDRVESPLTLKVFDLGGMRSSRSQSAAVEAAGAEAEARGAGPSPLA